MGPSQIVFPGFGTSSGGRHGRNRLLHQQKNRQRSGRHGRSFTNFRSCKKLLQRALFSGLLPRPASDTPQGSAPSGTGLRGTKR